ncbi:predicted protein [Naegleria gruberi]|uniref:Predicted protein n=1 Tax=Naegleria gruberi TaxID=5762 RepID=D2UXN0_NAEGR|nr:uncharacterized protein NAEGRDRAFT_61183 [Naegleria gruberi]EFC50313.1 predicted protein [Naegleria gruberi]|eukprot:XP_002683057.1 predicted protein [Naegleria gruberi strain NEG-M]
MKSLKKSSLLRLASTSAFFSASTSHHIFQSKFYSSSQYDVKSSGIAKEKVEKKLSKIERLFSKNTSSKKKNYQTVEAQTKAPSPLATPLPPSSGTSTKSKQKLPENEMINSLISGSGVNLTPEEIEKAKDTLNPSKKQSSITSPILGNRSFSEDEVDDAWMEQMKGPFYYRTIIRLIEKQRYLSEQDRNSLISYVKKEFRDRSKNVEAQYQIADNFVHIMRAKDLKSAQITTDALDNNQLDESKELTYWNEYYKQHGYVEEWYCDWDVIKSYLPEAILKLKTKPNKESLQILDIGCGLSTVSLHLTGHMEKQLCSVTSIDISNMLIALMSDSYADIADIISFKQMDVRDLSFEDNTFDFIFDKATFDSILSFDSSTISDLTSYESEVYRTLKPGGVLMLCSVNPFEGIEGFFSGQTWSSIKLAGSKNLLEDHTTNNRSLQLADDSVLGNAFLHFYHIKKPTE